MSDSTADPQFNFRLPSLSYIDAKWEEPALRSSGASPRAVRNTGLAAWLTQRAVQTLVVAGAVTSGCVRASVVDAMSLGFRPLVVSDCVGDRAIGPHEASLFDMEQKYATVTTLRETLATTTNRPTSPANVG